MATTMQPEIPWNVAGIAPEAREAARTSARREGLSVGEWLTRRILRGLRETGAHTDEWWFAENSRTPSNENPVLNGRDQNRGGQSKLDQHPMESRQHNNRQSASGDAAGPIKLPARKDSDTAEQLNERIVRLDARIARVEIRAAAEEAKHADSIKALQTGLAELKEQVSRTAGRGASKDTQLARAIEVVTEKFLQFQGETTGQQNAAEAQMTALAEDTAAISQRLEATREEGELQLRSIDDRVAATEVAVGAIRRDEGGAERLSGSLDQLTRRFETAEAEYLNNVERFESRLTRIEAHSGEDMIDRRLQSIEQALADMTRLIEKSAPEKPPPLGAPISPERPWEKPEGAHAPDVPPHLSSFGARAGMPILDLPPFPEKPKSSFAPSPESVPGSQDLRAPANHASAFEDTVGRAVPPEVGSILAPARGENASQARNAPFSWIDPAAAKKAEATPTRLFLLGGLGLLVFAAIGTGFYFSNTLGRSLPHTTARSIHHPLLPAAQKRLAAQPQVHATRVTLSPAAPAKQVTTTTPGATPGQVLAKPESRATTLQKALVPSATRPSPAAAPAKQLTPLERLAVLANAGHAKAQEVLGLAYLDGDGVAVNEAEGAKWLQRAAERGEAVAEYRLGTLYERGHGVAADPAKATQWYAVAAKAGNRKAMHNLAVAYAQGAGVPKNLGVAAQWFSRAANLGLADSEFNLAVLYERGLGVPQSLGEAYKWYAIAAAQGDAGSRARMDAIASQLSANDKAAAEKFVARFQPAPMDRAANAPPIGASLLGGA